MKIEIFAASQDTSNAHLQLASAVNSGGGVILNMTHDPKKRCTTAEVVGISDGELIDILKNSLDFEITK